MRFYTLHTSWDKEIGDEAVYSGCGNLPTAQPTLMLCISILQRAPFLRQKEGALPMASSPLLRC